MLYTQVRTFKPYSGLSDSNILNKEFFQVVLNFVYVYVYIHVQYVRHRGRVAGFGLQHKCRILHKSAMSGANRSHFCIPFTYMANEWVLCDKTNPSTIFNY
jgi:hypothetical protein